MGFLFVYFISIFYIFFYILCSNLDILVCRVFEVSTNCFCLVQVHPARLLDLQVLEDYVICGKVQVVEEKYRLNSDSPDKSVEKLENLLDYCHCHCGDSSLQTEQNLLWLCLS